LQRHVGYSSFHEKERMGMPRRELSEYVRRVMKAKGLTQKDVQRLSGGKITAGYVASLSIGRAKNPSAEKLKALGDGLGVHPDVLFHIACGMPEPIAEGQKSSPVAELLMIMETVQKAVVIPEVVEIIKELIRLSPQERAKLLMSLKRMGAVKRKSRGKNGNT